MSLSTMAEPQVVSKPKHARLGALRQGVLRRYANLRVGARRSEMTSGDSRIVLTFDDFGSKTQINRLLRILDTQRVRAVFFLIGSWAESNPDLVQKIRDKGHFVANHTYSHPDLDRLPSHDIQEQITGGVTSAWLRPPRGRYNGRIRRLAKQLGYDIKYWSIDSDDWQGSSSQAMQKKIMDEIHPGAVILFHLHADATADLLPALLPQLRERGYKLVQPGEELWGVK